MNAAALANPWRTKTLARSLPAMLRSEGDWRAEWSLARLSIRPPFSTGQTDVLGPLVRYTHPQSFVAQYRDIFQQEVYGFRSDRPDPLIYDCGANIGLATIYWKRKYPSARIVCFEPDPSICALLRANLATHHLNDVDVFEAAVWSSEGTLGFAVQGAGGGHLGGSDVQVRTVRLADQLRRDTACHPVDMLKIDIEGAEVEVLEDCRPDLLAVERLFVEYHEAADGPQRLGSLVALLTSVGFRLSIRHEVAATAPFLRSGHDGTPMQLNVWAWRE